MNRPAEASAKKPYQAPKLIIYGNLTEMTQASGSMQSSLDGATMGNRKTAA
jgi:hypothetical protein